MQTQRTSVMTTSKRTRRCLLQTQRHSVLTTPKCVELLEESVQRDGRYWICEGCVLVLAMGFFLADNDLNVADHVEVLPHV